MRLHKLTAAQVKRASRRKTPPLLGDGGHLYLQRGSSWIFRWDADGVRRHMGLGAVYLIDDEISGVTLAQARQKAEEARRAILEGSKDPIQLRRASRLNVAAAAKTFRQCAEMFIRSHKAGWRGGRSEAQWESSLSAYVYPTLGDVAVSTITTEHVLSAIGPHWATKTETLSRTRGRIESILDWARVKGYREGENPARWKGHLDHLLPSVSKVAKVQHLAAMPYREIGAFMTELRRQGSVPAKALEFTILTATRSGEVTGADWSEIDLAERLWVIPAERTKTGVEHRVPLSDRAVAILAEMAAIGGQSGAMFPGQRMGRPMSHGAMLVALRAIRDDVSVHGFRSCFRDWAAEATNFPSEAAELALGHAVGERVAQAYRRGDLMDKRRALMSAWASFCARPVEDAEVIQLRAS